MQQMKMDALAGLKVIEMNDVKRVCLVEPDLELLHTREFLLIACGYSVLPAGGYQDVYQLRSADAPHVAILGNSLDLRSLKVTAERIRRTWPRSRILVVGPGALCLDDHLYDETVEAPLRPKEFIAMVQRCYECYRNLS